MTVRRGFGEQFMAKENQADDHLDNSCVCFKHFQGFDEIQRLLKFDHAKDPDSCPVC